MKIRNFWYRWRMFVDSARQQVCRERETVNESLLNGGHINLSACTFALLVGGIIIMNARGIRPESMPFVQNYFAHPETPEEKAKSDDFIKLLTAQGKTFDLSSQHRLQKALQTQSSLNR